MNIRDLEYFLKIDEVGSLNTAAKELFITPQGLSNILTKMEQELGCSLFYRTRSGMVMTHYGKALRPYAEKIIQDYSRAITEIDHVRAEENDPSAYR